MEKKKYVMHIIIFLPRGKKVSVMTTNDAVAKSLKYIDCNVEKQLSLKDIADFTGYSEYHFARLFKKYTGMSVMDYVLQAKMKRAAEDIVSGDKIIDVALKYGYQSHAGFTKAFKNEFGFSPILLRTMGFEMEYLGGKNMRRIALENTDEHATKEELYEILCEKIERMNISISKTRLKNAYDFACKIYSGLNRYSGDEYVTHTINVAIILTQLEASEETIIAGLICDALTKTNVSKEDIVDKTSDEVYKMLVKAKNLIVAEELNSDENAVLLKLAERLHNMRTIQFMEEKKRAIKAKETLEIYMLLARKMGNESLAKELNELAIKYIE